MRKLKKVKMCSWNAKKKKKEKEKEKRKGNYL